MPRAQINTCVPILEEEGNKKKEKSIQRVDNGIVGSAVCE